MPSQCLQHITLRIHHDRVYIIYTPGPDLHISGWLSGNNLTENKDQEMTGINVNVNVISTSVIIPVCTSIGDIQVATQEDTHI